MKKMYIISFVIVFLLVLIFVGWILFKRPSTSTKIESNSVSNTYIYPFSMTLKVIMLGGPNKAVGNIVIGTDHNLTFVQSGSLSKWDADAFKSDQDKIANIVKTVNSKETLEVPSNFEDGQNSPSGTRQVIHKQDNNWAYAVKYYINKESYSGYYAEDK